MLANNNFLFLVTNNVRSAILLLKFHFLLNPVKKCQFDTGFIDHIERIIQRQSIIINDYYSSYLDSCETVRAESFLLFHRTSSTAI